MRSSLAAGGVGIPNNSETHRLLMREIASGDAVAFSELYDQLHSLLHVACCWEHRSAEQIDEILFSVWMTVWTDAASFSFDGISIASQLINLTEQSIDEWTTVQFGLM